jgi:hypothetical protein
VKRIAILIPSKGRPQQLSECVRSFAETTQGGSVDFFALLDDDDPDLSQYRAWGTTVDVIPLVTAPGRFGPKVNEAVKLFRLHSHFAFLGDDVRCRSVGWDTRVRREFADLPGGTGIVYPDDGQRGESYANHFVVSRDIVDALGYAWMPGLEHYWGDCVLNTLGRDLGLMRYLPDVLWEHLHTSIGKSSRDQTSEWNDQTMLPGQATYQAWERGEGRVQDREKVRAILPPP